MTQLHVPATNPELSQPLLQRDCTPSANHERLRSCKRAFCPCLCQSNCTISALLQSYSALTGRHLCLLQEPLSTHDLRWGGAGNVPSTEQLAERRAAAEAARWPVDYGPATTGRPDEELVAEIDALAVLPPPAAGVFGADPGRAACAAEAVAAAATPQGPPAAAGQQQRHQRWQQQDPPMPKAVAWLEGFDVMERSAHPAAKLDARIQECNDTWR